jgi:basic membrane protein A and related proteins
MRVAGLLFGQEGAGSFVQAGARGMRLAARKAGCALELVHCDEIAVAQRVVALEALARSAPDLIIVHGGQGVVPLEQVASRWPHQRFVLAQGSFRAPNVACYRVLLEQAAYLAGALAAWSTRTGVIAHLSGEPVGPGRKGEAAFRLGALQAAPEVRVLSHFCGHQHDAALARAAVLAQAHQGADIVFTMLGQGRDGAIAACRAAGLRQIGDGIDWCAVDPELFMASAFADSAWCGQQAIQDAMQGRFAPLAPRTAGLEQPEVCRLILHADTPAHLRERMGTVQVPAGL